MTFQFQRFMPHQAPEAFEEAIQIRRIVFVEEQHGSPEIEPDSYDANATQWLITDTLQQQAVGTGRMFSADGANEVVKIGRIAVLPSYRRRGLAEQLMRNILEHAQDVPYRTAQLEAQTHAMGLYAKLGFEPIGEPFLDEDGIEHILMSRSL